MIDSDNQLSEQEYERIYKSLENSGLNNDYDVVITSADMKLSIYDPTLLDNINLKLDFIIDKLNDNSTVVKNIKHVLGGI